MPIQGFPFGSAIANLMVLMNPDNAQDVDKEEMEKSINLVRDYLNDVDRIDWMFDQKKRIEKEKVVEKGRLLQ